MKPAVMFVPVNVCFMPFLVMPSEVKKCSVAIAF
jgi:hypothetical protein